MGIPYANTPYKALKAPEIRGLFKYRFPLAQIKRLPWNIWLVLVKFTATLFLSTGSTL
jgi:hypothetical protein